MVNLQAIKERCEKVHRGARRFIPAHISEGDAEVRAAEGWLICCAPSDDIAYFIAAAHQDVPALVERVEQQAKEIERLRNEIDRLWRPLEMIAGLRQRIDPLMSDKAIAHAALEQTHG